MIKGYKNEFDFIYYLNGKKIKNLNPIFQDLISSLFDKYDENDIIKAYKYGRYAKADFVIQINDNKKGISLKYGINNSVHLEPIYKFNQYLNKFSVKSVDLLLRYLYSDGSNNNSGTQRISSNEYKKLHFEEIKCINIELSGIKRNLIERFLFEADIHYKVGVDAIIYGSPHDFLWATFDEILDYLCSLDIESSGVHASNLFIQLWNKNLSYNPIYEKCRNYIQIKWYNIFDDIIKIMIKRNS